METKKQLRFAAAAIALAAVAAPLGVVGGCNDDGFQNPLDTVCCTAYKPGTNMLDTDWGIDDPATNASFSVAIQAIGDFSGTATAMVNDLGTLCRNLAVELGEPPDSVDEVDPGQNTTAWCEAAAARITAISANVTVTYQPAQCTFSAEVQASCEAECDINAECTPGSVEARCTGGELTVKCMGECSGSCDGSANVAVSCNGTCSGDCAGECDGTAQNGGSCSGVCNGQCRGSCEIDAGATASCEGECRGSCTGTATAPKCTAELDPPECELEGDCQASCDASASAKAECTPPAVSVDGDAGFELQVAVLEKYLPEIIVIGEARGEILSAQAEAMITVSGNLEGALSGDGTAAFCLPVAATSIVDAGENIAISVAAAGGVIATFK